MHANTTHGEMGGIAILLYYIILYTGGLNSLNDVVIECCNNIITIDNWMTIDP